ncbi:hypothetical protein FOT55_09660 [Serratia bockelmannii]|nr:hypothetical protein FOT55_09660 [Serratia bockelmannii]
MLMALGGGGRSSPNANGSQPPAAMLSMANASGLRLKRRVDSLPVGCTWASIRRNGYGLFVVIDRGHQLAAAETAGGWQSEAHL